MTHPSDSRQRGSHGGDIDLIILGASARAAAGSARRAGYRPACIDLYADRDLRAIAPVRQCPAHQYPQGLIEQLDQEEDWPKDIPVVYTGALENHPRLIAQIESRRPLWGCSAATLRAVRHPRALASLPTIAGIKICPAYFNADDRDEAHELYLVKPKRSAGGCGVRFWSIDDPVDDDHYLQPWIAGVPVAAAYSVRDGLCLYLGATRQIVGDPELGAPLFCYAGSVGPMTLTPSQQRSLVELGRSVAARFNLRGVYGIDLILDPQGQLWPIEVNPRYPASVEILEAVGGFCAFAPPCHGGNGPGERNRRKKVRAKGILYATRRACVPYLYRWFTTRQVADVPGVNRWFDPGECICTLFSEGCSVADAWAGLHDLARHCYESLCVHTASTIAAGAMAGHGTGKPHWVGIEHDTVGG